MMRKLSLSLCLLILTIALVACDRVKADLADPLLPELDVQLTQPVATATLEATAEPVVEAQPVDECLACHSNKELLIQVAEPEVETESESKGTG